MLFMEKHLVVGYANTDQLGHQLQALAFWMLREKVMMIDDNGDGRILSIGFLIQLTNFHFEPTFKIHI